MMVFADNLTCRLIIVLLFVTCAFSIVECLLDEHIAMDIYDGVVKAVKSISMFSSGGATPTRLLLEPRTGVVEQRQ